MEKDLQSVLGILIAALGGAAIGVERQHSGHAIGPHSRFAGLRTFTLLGGIAGISAYLWTTGFEIPGAILMAGAVTLILASYFAASRKDIDATTEVAALIVLAAGFLSGVGAWILSSAIIAITSVLLVEKSRLHTLIEGLPDVGLRAGFRFGLMALVILPLLPEGPYGPMGGIRPRELWMIVLLISGLSFLGYAARLIAGAGRGYVVTGLLGGLISSTNVTFTLSRLSATETRAGLPLALGVLTACTVMYLRVAALTAVLNPNLSLALIPYWVAPVLVGIVIAAVGLWRSSPSDQETAPQANPLQVGAALQMALLFQIVLFALAAVKDHFGPTGILLSGAVLGLTDVDALTISMSKSAAAAEQVQIVAKAVALGCLSNSFFKLGIAILLGRGKFRRIVVAGFLAIILAAALSLAYTLITGQPDIRIKS